MRVARMCLAVIVTSLCASASMAMAQQRQGPPPDQEAMRGSNNDQPQELRRGPRSRQFDERPMKRGDARRGPQRDEASGPDGQPQRDGQPQLRKRLRQRAEAHDGRGGTIKHQLKRRMLRRHLMQRGERPFAQRFHQRGLHDGAQSSRREFQRPGQRFGPRGPMMQGPRNFRDLQRPMPHTGVHPFGSRLNPPMQRQKGPREMHPRMRERLEGFRQHEQHRDGAAPQFQRTPRPMMPPPGAE